MHSDSDAATIGVTYCSHGRSGHARLPPGLPTQPILRRGQQRSNALLLLDQDHRAIKRIVRPMLGFKNFRCARIILCGIELMHMIAKGQTQTGDAPERSVAEQFYDFAM